MEDILSLMFMILFIEVIFWGLAYFTGSLLIPIVSLGRWRPEVLVRDGDTGKRQVIQSGFTLIERSGETYLGAFGVSIIGMCFWIVVVISLCVI